MVNYKIVQVAVLSSFAFVMLLGIAPYCYSFKRKMFITYPPILIYGILVAVFFSATYLPEVYQEVINYEDEKDISKIYSAMNILSAVVSYIVLIAYHKRIVIFLNRAQKEFRLMKLSAQDNIKEARFKMCQFWLKAALFPVILCANITFKQLYLDYAEDNQESMKHLLKGYIGVIPYVIQSAPSTCLYGILLLTSFYMNKLIANVEVMVREISLITFHRDLKIHKNFYKKQRFCELSDELDAISVKYTRILKSTQEYVGFVEIPWIASLGCNMIGVTYGIFAQYTFIANTLFDGESYDCASAFTGGIFIMVSALEIFLQANIATENTNMFHRMGVILHEGNMANADKTFKRSAEVFTLQVMQDKYKIVPCGLFIVDMVLVQGMISTGAGFLLILIQSDLSGRFG